MTRRVCLLLSILAAGVFRASADDVVFRSDVALARVDAQVLDRDNRAVTGLTAADFIVREDGVQREVLRVEPATTPIEITLVLDTSDAADPYIPDMRQALSEFVKETAKGNEMAVTTFGARPQVLQTYTGNAVLLDRAVGRLFAERGAGAYLLDALGSVARGIAKRAPERAAIVAVVVQAAPEFSGLPYENVLRSLRESGALFDSVTVMARGAAADATIGQRASAMHDRDTVLDRGARASGGTNVQALSSLALTPELKRISAQLRSQYRLVYSRPESLIPPEKIEVATKKSTLTARGTPVRAPRTTQQHE